MSTLDHIEPRSKGGRNAMDNLTGACQPCNAAKGSRTLLLYLLDRMAG
jgi:5-methylcytosine-specific restriction endonuclease McrA